MSVYVCVCMCMSVYECGGPGGRWRGRAELSRAQSHKGHVGGGETWTDEEEDR